MAVYDTSFYFMAWVDHFFIFFALKNIFTDFKQLFMVALDWDQRYDYSYTNNHLFSTQSMRMLPQPGIEQPELR